MLVGIFVLSMGLSAGAVFAQEPQEPRPHQRGRRIHRVYEAATIIADTLGMSLDELKAELKAGNTLEEIAAAQGVDLSEIAEALYDYGVEQVETALAEDKIDQDQADRILATLTERRDACVDEGQCNFFKQRSQHRKQLRRRLHRAHPLAEALGMTRVELAQALRSGQSLEEVVATQGLSMADLAQILYEQGVERVEIALAEGKINQDQADRILTKLTEGRDVCINEGQCNLLLRGRAPKR